MTSATIDNATVHRDLELVRVWTQFLAVAHEDAELLAAASVIWSGVHDVDSLPASLRNDVHELARAFDGHPPDETTTSKRKLPPGAVERILIVTGHLRNHLETCGIPGGDDGR